MQYACNGAPGADVQIASEPEGTNCPNGGLRVTAADGAVSYVCAAEAERPIAATLCPGSTFAHAPGGAGMFMQVDGDFPIQGSAFAPEVNGYPAIEGAIRLAAICHGFEAVTSGGAITGRPLHRPFTVVTALDRAAPLLLQALDEARHLRVHIRVHGVNPEGGRTLSARVELENATPVLLEQFVAPDPEQPETNKAWVRLALIYQRYEYATLGPEGVHVQSAQPSFTPLEAATPCAPVQTDRDPMIALLKVNGSEVPGSSKDPSHPGSIDVLGTCLRIERGYSGGSLTGKTSPGPLVLVKPHDSASPAIQQAILENRIAELTLKLRQRDPTTGAWEEPFEEEVRMGRVLAYEQFLLDGTRMERVQLGYSSLRQTWLEGSVTWELTSNSP